MERQLLELFATLLLGLALGCLYSALRVLRGRGGAAASALLDLGFCAVFAAALFAVYLVLTARRKPALSE